MRKRDRIDRVTTSTGDSGQTLLADGQRYAKYDPKIELVGVLDEANSAIGLLTVLAVNAERDVLLELQSRLFDIGGSVATGKTVVNWKREISSLSAHMEGLNRSLEPLREFVLPGGTEAAARAHYARSVVRRAERCFWRCDLNLLQKHEVGVYLNRLSDYLFVLARTFNDKEVLWNPLRQ